VPDEPVLVKVDDHDAQLRADNDRLRAENARLRQEMAMQASRAAHAAPPHAPPVTPPPTACKPLPDTNELYTRPDTADSLPAYGETPVGEEDSLPADWGGAHTTMCTRPDMHTAASPPARDGETVLITTGSRLGDMRRARNSAGREATLTLSDKIDVDGEQSLFAGSGMAAAGRSAGATPKEREAAWLRMQEEQPTEVV
jgi:hypothetical protein